MTQIARDKAFEEINMLFSKQSGSLKWTGDHKVNSSYFVSMMDALAMRLGLTKATWDPDDPPIAAEEKEPEDPLADLKSIILSGVTRIMDTVDRKIDHLSARLPDILAQAPISCSGRSRSGAMGTEKEVLCLEADSEDHSLFMVGEMARAACTGSDPETELQKIRATCANGIYSKWGSLTEEETTWFTEGHVHLGVWVTALSQPDYKGGIAELQALLLNTSARVEVIVSEGQGISKGVELKSVGKNCTVFFSRRGGKDESSPEVWYLMAKQDANGKLQKVFLDGQETEEPRNLFTRFPRGSAKVNKAIHEISMAAQRLTKSNHRGWDSDGRTPIDSREDSASRRDRPREGRNRRPPSNRESWDDLKEIHDSDLDERHIILGVTRQNEPSTLTVIVDKIGTFDQSREFGVDSFKCWNHSGCRHFFIKNCDRPDILVIIIDGIKGWSTPGPVIRSTPPRPMSLIRI